MFEFKSLLQPQVWLWRNRSWEFRQSQTWGCSVHSVHKTSRNYQNYNVHTLLRFCLCNGCLTDTTRVGLLPSTTHKRSPLMPLNTLFASPERVAAMRLFEALDATGAPANPTPYLSYHPISSRLIRQAMLSYMPNPLVVRFSSYHYYSFHRGYVPIYIVWEICFCHR